MALLHTPICNFGEPAHPFTLADPGGAWWSLDDCRGENGTLIMFICNHCPYVKAIREKLVRDARELADLGVKSVAIMSNDWQNYPEDAPDHMRRIAREFGFPFPYLVDDTQEVARAYGAICTPDFFGYNADLELQYRGRLDGAGARTDAPDEPRELFLAMQQVAATGRGPAEQVASMGCSIKWRADNGEQ